MSITLTHEAESLELPGGLQWLDRDWSPVVQSVTPCFGGQLVIDSFAFLSGRPITLQSGPDYAYLSADQCAKLREWASIPALTMTLSGLRGEPVLTVVFRHEETALSTEPVGPDNNAHEALRWKVIIRLRVLA